MAPHQSRSMERWTKIFLGCAALWSVGLLAAGVFVNSYSSSNGPGQTLIQENGDKALIPLSIPFVASAIVATALWSRQRRQMRGAGILAWSVFGVVAALTLLGVLTIGPFIVPVTIFLAVAITRFKNYSDIAVAPPKSTGQTSTNQAT